MSLYTEQRCSLNVYYPFGSHSCLTG
jgi:hypothetical protein